MIAQKHALGLHHLCALRANRADALHVRGDGGLADEEEATLRDMRGNGNFRTMMTRQIGVAYIYIRFMLCSSYMFALTWNPSRMFDYIDNSQQQ